LFRQIFKTAKNSLNVVMIKTTTKKPKTKRNETKLKLFSTNHQ